MPVNREMMSNMKKEYGAKKGEDVYYAMENKMKSRGKSMSTHSGSAAKARKQLDKEHRMAMGIVARRPGK